MPDTPLPPPVPAAVPVSVARLQERHFQVNWALEDIEQRLGFRGGRFTNVNKLFSFILGGLLTVVFFLAMAYLPQTWPEASAFSDMFLKRGICQYPTMMFFFWGLVILWIKSLKLKFQKKALELAAVPQQPDFELTRSSAKAVLDRVHELVDHPGNFLLLNRIERALSNLKNIGQVSDITSILKMQSENDDEQISSSYSLLTGFIWAIPVLGFIGTVLGLSQAIGAFGLTLQGSADMAAVKSSLQGVTGGLATAFETTLVALVNALILQLLTTFMQTKEGEFLDACNDYCHRNVASRLRLGSAPVL
ncbi:MAG TPA: MotA/TolQ/ExbB proton channel family protein [Verrucomicrobiales bacterium]|nr:MotA/TolQ/ExbB proton channel family protein [Verrucomicrobiales bacterium]